MPSPTTYAVGTASVESGETLVTISGMSLEGVLFAGDLFAVPSQPLVPPQRIAADPVGNTFLLWADWPGATLSGAPYEVRFVGDGVRTTSQTRRYLELLGQLSALGLQPNAFGELADRDAYDDEAAGFIFLEIGDPWTLYIKLSDTSADWDDGQTIEGAAGAAATIAIGTVTTVAPGNPATVTNVGTATEAELDFEIPEGAAATIAIGTVTTVAPGSPATVTNVGTVGDAELDFEIPAGEDGTDPGVLLTWDDGTADADPGAGLIRADNADLSAATMLFVSKTNRATDNIASWLLGLASSTSANKGQLTLTRSGGNAQALFDFSAVTDATGYVKLSVSGHSGATSFVGLSAISLQVEKTGNAGDGDGDVVGPAGATDGRVALFDGVTGKLLKDSGIVLGTAAEAAIDTDDTLAADADDRVASQKAVRTYVLAVRDALIAAAPGALDTLDELAAALGDDENFAATVTTALAGKQPLDSDLTAIAALTTTSYGRALLELANQAALMGLLADASTSGKGIVELATAAEYRGGSDTGRALSVAEVWGAAGFVTIADAATLTFDMSQWLSLIQTVLGGNRTVGDPASVKPGQHFMWKLTATGSTRTFTLHADFKVATGVESFPLSITTSETVYVYGFGESANVVRVTAVQRFA